jgi:ATP-dependent Clp protease, protease subunit
MPKSEAMRLISEFKSSSGDPAGGGEGDPTERIELRPDSLSSAAALAASLTSINS